MKIILWPHPTLKLKSELVTTPPDTNLIAEMFSTMERAGGVGLSAIQVGIPQQLFVASIAGNRKVFINTLWSTDELAKKIPVSEGCLSTPGQYETVYRYQQVYVTFAGVDLKQETVIFTDTWAQMVQHEWEHGQGLMFTDHLNSAARSRVMGNMMAMRKKGLK